jgi:hypothetical protein
MVDRTAPLLPARPETARPTTRSGPQEEAMSDTKKQQQMATGTSRRHLGSAVVIGAHKPPRPWLYRPLNRCARSVAQTLARTSIGSRNSPPNTTPRRSANANQTDDYNMTAGDAAASRTAYAYNLRAQLEAGAEQPLHRMRT